ncbi:hypothetical protein BK653_02580 [Pseudomonas brassicacearum]|nr:hypothetical protein BK653_02580 [Pseudomonas brassicacearum]
MDTGGRIDDNAPCSGTPPTHVLSIPVAWGKNEIELSGRMLVEGIVGIRRHEGQSQGHGGTFKQSSRAGDHSMSMPLHEPVVLACLSLAMGPGDMRQQRAQRLQQRLQMFIGSGRGAECLRQIRRQELRQSMRRFQRFLDNPLGRAQSARMRLY